MLSPEEAGDSEYNLLDGFKIIHQEDEIVKEKHWRYYLLHRIIK